MRDYAEMIAEEIRNTTELEVQVTSKQMPDGTERYAVTVREPGANIAPSIYVDEMQEHGLDVKQSTVEVLKLYETHKAPKVDIDWFSDFEQVKSKLFVKLLPKTFKTEIFRSAKAYGFEDLILVPYASVEFGNGDSGSVLIKPDHIEKWGVDKKKVLDEAIKNTKKEDVYIKSLGAFVTEHIGFDTGLPEDLFGPLIISNKETTFGASAILGRIKDLKEKFVEGFFVIPSSVHEVLIMPKAFGEMDENCLNAMVREVNATTVLPEEVLSNHVYAF